MPVITREILMECALIRPTSEFLPQGIVIAAPPNSEVEVGKQVEYDEEFVGAGGVTFWA
jgi:hypothetical protein